MKEDNVHFSVRTKAILFCLLIILGLIFRYPTTPHEIGLDSFSVHLMANSISEFGYAKWWLHPISITGSYPYSTTPSAVPFLLSGISQCIIIDVEHTILLYSVFLGFFGIFGAYLMAKVIWDNDIYKFLVAFVFSTSNGIIAFSTWTAHSRTLFVIFLPFFIYVLLATRNFKVRNLILTTVLLLLLLVTHHYIYFIVPIMISYFAITIVYKAGRNVNTIQIPENLANFAIFVLFLIMFLIPYFNRSIWHSDPELLRTGGASTIYIWLSSVMLAAYVRYVGVLIILVIGGYFYLIFKLNKRFEEWFLLLCLAGLAPLLYIATYMKWFILPFTSLLAGISLSNIILIKTVKKKRVIKHFLIIVLVFSIIFTGYFQYLHFLNDQNPRTRYMEEGTYMGGLWIKTYVDDDKRMVAERYISHRIFSISEVPTLSGVEAADLAYGFFDSKNVEIKKIYSPFSVNYYFRDPYKTVNESFYTKTVWSANALLESDYGVKNSWAQRIVSVFNLSYYISHSNHNSLFAQSVRRINNYNNNLYDNGKIKVWYLN